MSHLSLSDVIVSHYLHQHQSHPNFEFVYLTQGGFRDALTTRTKEIVLTHIRTAIAVFDLMSSISSLCQSTTRKHSDPQIHLICLVPADASLFVGIQLCTKGII